MADFTRNNANVPLKGTKNLGKSISNQVNEIAKAKRNIEKAKFI